MIHYIHDNALSTPLVGSLHISGIGRGIQASAAQREEGVVAPI